GSRTCEAEAEKSILNPSAGISSLKLKQPGFQDLRQKEPNDRAFPTKIKTSSESDSTKSILLPDSSCEKGLNNLHFNRIIQIVIRIFAAKPRCSGGVNKG
ncbi:8873_t:CDS:2, partial [Funneliformis caledonium]